MTSPPGLSPDEPFRLQALRALNVVETPLEERFERITRLARSVLGADIVAVSLVEADRQFFKSIQGLDVCGTSRDVSFCGHTILADDLFFVPDARRDARFESNPLVTGPPHIVTYVAMPLRSPDGFKVGTLCVIHTSLREVNCEDLQHLRDLAALAELELQVAAGNAVQAALVEDVAVEQRRALIDSLTRLWNREGILRFADEALRQSRQKGEGTALVMVDLDGFKEINDSNGHAVGDEVIRIAARRLLSGVREGDAVGRLGGDEFLCVLTSCESAEAALQATERLRESLTASPIGTDQGEIPLQASFGVRFAPHELPAELDELIASADEALYECKQAGRDGVRLASTHRQVA
jgi:diguanylate cyclase (GGDEF)-like protein